MVTVEKHLMLKVADAVWLATAMLHREHPRRDGFTVAEIVAKVKEESLTDGKEQSIYLHANQHCVANRPPNDAKLRMLFETRDGMRRLFCAYDVSNAERDGRTLPKQSDLPVEMGPIFRWYQDWSAKRRSKAVNEDPLLALAGSGHGMWSEDAVKHVSHLRAE